MDKKSKVLFVCFIFLIIASIAVSFYKYIYLEDITFLTDSKNIPSGFDPIRNLFNKI